MPKESKKFINPLLRPSSDAEPNQETPIREADATQISAATSTSTQTSVNEPLSQTAAPLVQPVGPATSPVQPVSPIMPFSTPSGTPVPYPQQSYTPPGLQPTESSAGVHSSYGYAGRETDMPPNPPMDMQQSTYTPTQSQTYMPVQPSTPAYPQQYPHPANPMARDASYPYHLPDRPTSDNPPVSQPNTNMPPVTYTNVASQPTNPYPVQPPSPSPLPQTYTPAGTYVGPSMAPSQLPPYASPLPGSEAVELPAYYSTTAVPRRRRGAQSFEQTHERITLWIDKRLKQAFDELSYEHDLSKTSLLNEAVADLLRKYASR